MELFYRLLMTEAGVKVWHIDMGIRRKIEDGKWLEGREYTRSPDGGIFISIKGYTRWVEKATA